MMHLIYFVLNIFDYAFERAWAALSILRYLKDLGLETGAHLCNPFANLCAFLVYQHKCCTGAYLSIEVAKLEATFMEARQNFAARHSENQFLESSLLSCCDRASRVCDLQARF